MYKLTQDPNVVIDTDTNLYIPQGHPLWDVYEQWVADGGIPQPLPVPTIDEVAAALTIAVQGWMDAKAQDNGYTDIATCCTYVNSGVVKWKADAQAALAWRDAVWQAAYDWEVAARAAPPAVFPTAATVIASLPQPEAFNWQEHAPGQSSAASGGTVPA
jgi:predicted acylesterase/phospholipase RssA